MCASAIRNHDCSMIYLCYLCLDMSWSTSSLLDFILYEILFYICNKHRQKENSWIGKERTISLLQFLDHIDHCPCISYSSKESLKFLNKPFKSSTNGANHTNFVPIKKVAMNLTQPNICWGSWFKCTPLSTQLTL